MSIKARHRPAATQDPTRRETRARDALLIALTVSTGAVDAISFLGLGKVFSAFMTGNLAFLGFIPAGAPGPSLSQVVAAMTAFAIGAAAAGRLVRPTTDRNVVWPLRVTIALAISLEAEAAFLGVWTEFGAHPSGPVGAVLISLLAFAMGLQTAAIASLGVRGVFTTAATATLMFLMGDLAGWKPSRSERLRLAAVVVGLVAGATIGALLMTRAPAWAPLFPVSVTMLVVGAAALCFRDDAYHGFGRADPRNALLPTGAASTRRPGRS